jgi:hypothetical protein
VTDIREGFMKRYVRFTAVVISVVWLLAGIAYGEKDLSSHEAAARNTAMGFMKELAAALQKELGGGGPAGAIGVCSDLAPSIAGRISRETGWRVSRVSMKVRNPLLGMPDAWEQKVLLDFEKKTLKGDNIDTMSYSEVVNEPGGRFFRYMKAISIKQPCLACHGTEEQIVSQVRTILNERYPHDMATGYKVGDLRGAISIKELLR